MIEGLKEGKHGGQLINGAMQLNIRGWFARWKELERKAAVVRMDAWK